MTALGTSSVQPAASITGLAVVVIGRNEGDRLALCLDSLRQSGVPVVYVDSGSTDGSVATARARGAEVVELDSAQPFSAARARNEGTDRCLALHPATWAVMFVDGDCVVEPGWLPRAAAELTADSTLAVVCGLLCERHPERSVFNRLADLEWAAPLGEVDASGGIAVFRVADFRLVGGFDASARAGEEPELCRRLRARGRRVVRIAEPMARHDLDMTRLSQWWRRQERFGYHGLALERQFSAPLGPDGSPMPSLFGGAIRRSRLWGVGWPTAMLAGLVGGGVVAGPWGALGAGALGLGVLGVQAARLAWRVRRQVPHATDALVYGALMLLDKWANLAGQVRYGLDRRAGRGLQLIEYRAGRPSTPRGGGLGEGSPPSAPAGAILTTEWARPNDRSTATSK